MSERSPSLAVQIAGLRFKNPIIAAAGTFGYGLEFAHLIDLNQLGGIAVKGLSVEPIPGNPAPRLYETAGGMLNSVGLHNIGVRAFVEQKLPRLRSYQTNIIANIFGFKIEDYVEAARMLNDAEGISALELNISCPNTKKGGMEFSQDPEATFNVVNQVKRVARRLPVIAKLSPNVADITVFARAAEEAGADAISLVNAFLGMAIDLEKRAPVFHNLFAGLTGPAIKPLALRLVYQAARAVRIPVIGIGGIVRAEDALEFLIAGAKAVEAGTATFINPRALAEIVRGLSDYLERNRIGDINDIIGSLAT